MSIPNCRSSVNVPCPFPLRTSSYTPTNTSAIRFRVRDAAQESSKVRELPCDDLSEAKSSNGERRRSRSLNAPIARMAAGRTIAKQRTPGQPDRVFFLQALYLNGLFNRSYSESFLPPSMKNWTVRAIPGFCRGDSFGACGGTFLKYFFLTITPLNAGVLPTAPMPYRLSTLIF